MAAGCRCVEHAGCSPLTQPLYGLWLVACSAAGYQIWWHGTDPLQPLRAAVLIALMLIALRTPYGRPLSFSGPARFVVYALIVLAFMHPLAAGIALAVLAWDATRRIAAVVLGLLILPLDPWFAAELQWPLQVVTAHIGGFLSGIEPSYVLGDAVYGNTVYLRIPCAAFCPIEHHNVAAGMIGYEPFRINEQCAGLNQVEGLFALMGAILLLLGPRLSRTHDLIFMLSAPLVAVVINGVRVALSVWLGRAFERGPWDGWLHDAPGYVVFGLTVFALAVLARRLDERRAEL